MYNLVEFTYYGSMYYMIVPDDVDEDITYRTNTSRPTWEIIDTPNLAAKIRKECITIFPSVASVQEAKDILQLMQLM